MTLKELNTGFVVCAVPVILCVFVFVLEWMTKLKVLMVIAFVFKEYFELKNLERLEYLCQEKENLNKAYVFYEY